MASLASARAGRTWPRHRGVTNTPPHKPGRPALGHTCAPPGPGTPASCRGRAAAASTTAPPPHDTEVVVAAADGRHPAERPEGATTPCKRGHPRRPANAPDHRPYSAAAEASAKAARTKRAAAAAPGLLQLPLAPSQGGPSHQQPPPEGPHANSAPTGEQPPSSRRGCGLPPRSRFKRKGDRKKERRGRRETRRERRGGRGPPPPPVADGSGGQGGWRRGGCRRRRWVAPRVALRDDAGVRMSSPILFIHYARILISGSSGRPSISHVEM
ncbi:unnamed protein product [Urochloa humidicola]